MPLPSSSRRLVTAAAVALVLAGCAPGAVDRPAGLGRPTADPVATLVPEPSPPAPSASPALPAVPDARVTIDPDVFAYDEDEGYSYETFVVAGADDPATTDALVTALRRAGSRFLATDETGEEHRTLAAHDAAATAGLYTPNYVSDPTPTGAGVEVYVDCKGVIEDAMAETFRRVLAEELAQVGVPLHVSVARF